MRVGYLICHQLSLSSIISILFTVGLYSQSTYKSILKLPDTGQTGDYSQVYGEDADYQINTPSLSVIKSNIVLDVITGLMWTQTDGGEMTIENAFRYADTLTLGGYDDWRLPSAVEAYSILNHQKLNPALDITVFSKSNAEYWWTGEYQSNDKSKVWCTNAGGGIGNHPTSETISAGGSKRFHVRAVRSSNPPVFLDSRFIDNKNGTITDLLTSLTWQQIPSKDSMNWENAIQYSENLVLGGKSDWRLPNIKELQSVNDYKFTSPSIPRNFFSVEGLQKFWSSTTLTNQTSKAWYLHTQYGITTYDTKTNLLNLLAVRGNNDLPTSIISSNSSQIKVYPNPGNQKLFLQLPYSVNIFKARLNNLLGQLLLTTEVNNVPSMIQEIDLSRFPPGCYILTLSRGKEEIKQKIEIAK